MSDAVDTPTSESTAPPRHVALGWRVVVFSMGLVATHVVVGSVVGAVVGVVYVVSGRATIETAAEALTTPEALVVLQAAAALPMLAMFLTIAIVVRRYMDRRSVRSMGLGRPRQGWPFTLAGGALAGGVPLAAAVGVLALAGAFSSWAVQTSWMTWLLLPTLVIMAFNEEITCRGYLLQTFVDEERPLLGVLVSSLIFWLFHALNPAVWSTPLASVNLFGAGIVLAFAYLATGNVWFPIVVHFAWNAVQGLVFELPVSGVETDGIVDLERTGAVAAWLTGGDFGLEGSVLVTAVELLLGAGFWLWWKKVPPTASVGSMHLEEKQDAVSL